MTVSEPRALPGSPERKQQTKDAQKIMRLLAHKLRALGFERTKPSFFIRQRALIIEFVHVHKFTFGPSFRIHFGIRVRNDTHTAAALNGPDSDRIQNPATPGLRYRLNFSTEPTSLNTCAEAMAAFVAAEGLAWFRTFEDPRLLLSAADSRLHQMAKTALQEALHNPNAAITSPATRQVLNAA
jgi:hypothetical protein